MTALALGVALFAVAGVADVVVHVVGASPSWETGAHLATLAGMVATLAGVVANRPSHHRHIRHEKEARNAVR